MKKFILKAVLAAILVNLIPLSAFAQSGKPDALKYYNERRYREAIEVCEEELKNNPNNIESYVVLCWALVSNRQYSEAEQRATDARKINSFDVRLIEVLGEAKYYLGKNTEAMNLFERYVSSSQGTASRLGRVYYFMGEIYIKQARYEHADVSISMAVRIEPLRDDWWTRLGYAREMASDYTSAIQAYDQSLRLNPASADASSGKVRCQRHI